MRCNLGNLMFISKQNKGLQTEKKNTFVNDMFAFKSACEQVLLGFMAHCLSQLMSAVASLTKAYETMPKGIVGGDRLPRFEANFAMLQCEVLSV